MHISSLFVVLLVVARSNPGTNSLLKKQNGLLLKALKAITAEVEESVGDVKQCPNGVVGTSTTCMCGGGRRTGRGACDNNTWLPRCQKTSGSWTNGRYQFVLKGKTGKEEVKIIRGPGKEEESVKFDKKRIQTFTADCFLKIKFPNDNGDVYFRPLLVSADIKAVDNWRGPKWNCQYEEGYELRVPNRRCNQVRNGELLWKDTYEITFNCWHGRCLKAWKGWCSDNKPYTMDCLDE